MKCLLPVICLLYSLSCKGYGRLELYPRDCRDTSEYGLNLNDQRMLLYTTSGQVISGRALDWEGYGYGFLAADSLPAGAYTLSYTNAFDMPVTRVINIFDDSLVTLQLCLDEVAPPDTSSALTWLEDGEEIAVSFYTTGCFHSYGMLLKIKQEGGGYTARLFTEAERAPLRRKKGRKILPDSGKLLREVRLDTAMLIAYARFEKELQLVKQSGGCTTTDYYHVYTPYGEISLVDGNCSWRGFGYLSRSLFGED